MAGQWLQTDAAQAWRCTQCSDFVHTGWTWWETPTRATMELCDHCVAEIVNEPKEER